MWRGSSYSHEMDLICPNCAAQYQFEIERFPAKVLCTHCGAKSLVDENGGMTLVEIPAAPAIAAATAHGMRRPTTTFRAPKRRESASPAIFSSMMVLVVVAGAAIMMNPEWKKKAMDAIGMSEPVPELAKPIPVAEETKAPEPEPEVTEVIPETVAPPVVAQVIPKEAPAVIAEPKVERKASTLEDASPDIARALAITDGRISTAPATAETEVRNFVRSLYVPRNGSTYANELSSEHPAILLSLLADLWKRIEDSPGAMLPESPPLSIMIGNRSRSQDMTATYVGLLEKEAAGGRVNEAGIEKIAASPEIAKLLEHFAKGLDSSTPDNALTLGRMINDVRNGDAPLSKASALGKVRSIEDLPKVGRSVDLGGFESVQDLVRWAHALSPSEAATSRVNAGTEATQMSQRAKAYLNLPTEVLIPHPNVSDFPGKVSPKAPRMEREVTIDTSFPRWHATGLYAAPGEEITIRVPSKFRNQGYKVVIGTHTDDLTGGSVAADGGRDLKRFPVVTGFFPLDETRVKVGNPFGGPIYIDVPYKQDEEVVNIPAHGETVRCYSKIPAPDPQKITIGGAIEMPWWKPGMTAEDWRKELAKPGPWVEMDFGMLRMAVPTEAAKEIRDPQKLTDFWKVVMDAQWKFGGFPGYRVIPMRVAWDRQISAGFMHSGYPIGAPLSALEDGINLSKIRVLGTWGLFHEIGHNHQPVCITPEGFGETTVNIFSLSAQAAILPNKDPNLGHPALADPRDLLKRRMAGENEAFVNLAVFLPLIKEFGMESLTKTMQLYWKEVGKSGTVNNLEVSEREDVWARRFGEANQRDVSAYFESVHYKVSPATRSALSKYKEWKP